MACPFPMLAFVASILVTMQLARASHALSTAEVFLSRSDPQDDLAKIHDQAVEIRKKLDSLALQCKVTQLKDKELLESLHRELRIVSGQLAWNVAQQSDAKHQVERGSKETEKLRGQLISQQSMCQTQKKHLDSSAKIHSKSQGRAKALRALKAHANADNPLLKSQLDTLAMHLGDQKDAHVTNQREQMEQCVRKEKQLNDRIRSSDSQHARSSAELVRITGVKAGLAASRAAIAQRVERTQRDADKFQATCKSGIGEYKGELKDILKGRQALANKVAGKRVAIQDCQVTEWVFSKCSKPCKKHANETAGFMKVSRSILHGAGEEGLSCPQLSANFTCKDKPCPTDCAVLEWAPWSTCSKACGGGTAKRTRRVTTQAKDGGKTCPSIEQRKSCNVGRCSDECKLKEWTPWSACTRQCKFSATSNSGQQIRKREVLGNPKKTGGGSPCPPADDEKRFQNRRCNEDICEESLRCDASQDVLFLLDGSGAAGVDFDHQRSLVSSIVKDSSDKVRFGVLAYGKEVKILSPITANRTQLAAISAYTPIAGGARDSAKGEILGRTLFAAPGVARGSPKVAVLLLGGAPAGFVNAQKASEELRAAGVRLIVGLVDDGSQLARQQACSLVSAPCSANVEAVKSWEQMAQEPGRLLSAICHDLATSA